MIFRFFGLLFVSAYAFAGPSGPADPHALAPTGFPGEYLASVRLSLAQDELYGTRFLDALQLHIRSVAGLTSRRAITGYLEQAVTGGRSLREFRATLGHEGIAPATAAALLVADALARPEQFREILEGLETMQSGFGVHAAKILRAAKGRRRDPALAYLRAAAARRQRRLGPAYDDDKRWGAVFDVITPHHADRAESHHFVARPPPEQQ